ncbi:MAG TPA: PF20097 family protein [Myxococcota bacterium]|nr:PF20097 family protein [Myxococcota bacterium]
MTRTSLRLWIWLPLATAAVLLLALVSGPIAYGWECYRLHAEGEHAEARVVASDHAEALVLTIASGPRAGEHCTAATSEAHRAELVSGDVLAVVLPDARPGECVLVATLENSMLFLWGLCGMVAAVLLMMVLVGLFLDRSFGRSGAPSARFDVGPIECPRCDAPMEEGYLPLLSPLHWRRPDEPIGLPTAFSGLPGTVGWRGRPSLHAYRCERCQIVTLRYGKP